MDWFRYHTSALDNPKVQTLPKALVLPWLNFMCLNRIYGDRLPDLATTAFRLRCSEKQAEEWRRELVQRRLIDTTPDGTFTMHDWDEWQPSSDDSAVRKRRQRARRSQGMSRDKSRDGHALEQSREEESRAEQTGARDFDPSETVTQIERRHTKAAGRDAGLRLITERITNSPDPPALAADLDMHHAAWWDYWQQPGNEQFTQRLDKWVESNACMDWPPKTTPNDRHLVHKQRVAETFKALITDRITNGNSN